MQRKNNKLKIFIIFLILLFIVFIYLFSKSFNYEKEYVIDDVKITEQYKNDYYTFIIKYKNNNYPYVFKEKYTRKRKLINDVIIKEGSELCLIPQSDYITFYPLCSKGKEIYTYNLSNKIMDYKYEDVNSINTDYKKNNIYYLDNKKFLLYDYKGFNYVGNKENKYIELFKNDVYNLELAYQINEFLLIPNYNDNYYFNKIYLINMNSGKKKEIVTDFNISFDSIFLGDYENKVFLFDKREEKEYAIDVNKERIDEVRFASFKNGKLIKVSYDKTNVENMLFEKEKTYKYELKDNKLYQNISNHFIKLSNLDVDKIICNIDNTVYYISEDKLYMYNNEKGEVLLISNFEWNFNNTNVIFISK